MKEYNSEEELTSILSAPYTSDKVRWRVGRAGESNGKIWAMLLAYVDARDFRARMDEAFGRMNWSVTYDTLSNGTIIATTQASCKINGDIVTKTAQDGAGDTQVEREKGGLSDAFKRSANAGFGIYESLYEIKDSFANIHDKGKFKGQFKGRDGKTKYFKYDPPAIQGDYTKPKTQPKQKVVKINNADEAVVKLSECNHIDSLKKVWGNIVSTLHKDERVLAMKESKKKELS